MSDFANFDFGFTMVDEDELDAVQTATTEAQLLSVSTAEAEGDLAEVRQKLDIMYQMIQPLLMNLAQDPEKEYILWPDRVNKVNTFKEMVDKVYMG